jgi:hypothetical protein
MPPHSDKLGEDDGMANGLVLVDGFGVGLRSADGLIDGALDATGIGAEVDGLGVGFGVGLGVRGPPVGVIVGS